MFNNKTHNVLKNKENIPVCDSCERSFHRHDVTGCYIAGRYHSVMSVGLCQECYYGWVRNDPGLITFSYHENIMVKSGFNPEVIS